MKLYQRLHSRDRQEPRRLITGMLELKSTEKRLAEITNRGLHSPYSPPSPWAPQTTPTTFYQSQTKVIQGRLLETLAAATKPPTRPHLQPAFRRLSKIREAPSSRPNHRSQSSQIGKLAQKWNSFNNPRSQDFYKTSNQRSVSPTH